MGILLLALLLPQDVEAKKEKIGDTLRFLVEEKRAAKGDKAKEADVLRLYRPLIDEMKKFVEEVAGPDPAKQGALIDELLAKVAPEESRLVKIASNERWASAMLMSIHTAQAMFRAADADGDGKQNFWVGDISALHRLRVPGAREPWVSADTARADARPCLPLDQEGAPSMAPLLRLVRAGTPQPSQGYYYVALRTYDVAGGDPVPYDAGDGRNPAKFGVCAYPADYGKDGNLTFIRSEAQKPQMWKKDTTGRPVSSFPVDPAREGWLPVD
ncbi:MAG TPA: DUF2950 family protein [Planctomycetota bacterium]